MKMRFGILLLLLGFCAPARTDAHEPERLALRFNPDKNKLGVKIIHKVGDAEDHHIARIEIQINGKGKTFRYNAQTNKSSMTKWYRLRVERGEIIQVSVYCSREGSLEAELEVGQEISVITGKPPRSKHWGYDEEPRVVEEKPKKRNRRYRDQDQRYSKTRRRRDNYYWYRDYYYDRWRYHRPEYRIIIHRHDDNDEDGGNGARDTKRGRPVWEPPD